MVMEASDDPISRRQYTGNFMGIHPLSLEFNHSFSDFLVTVSIRNGFFHFLPRFFIILSG